MPAMKSVSRQRQPLRRYALVALALSVGAIVIWANAPCSLLQISKLSSRSYQSGRLSVAHDGRSVVFGCESENTNKTKLVALGYPEMSAVTLMEGEGRIGMPAYSPNGEDIAFVRRSNDSDKGQIWMMDAAGKNAHQLCAGVFNDDSPSFHPGGDSMIFIRATSKYEDGDGGSIWKDFDIWSMNVDGTKQVQLTKSRFSALQPPYFSDHGKQIVFAGARGAGSRNVLYTVDVLPDGNVSDPRQITIDQVGTSDFPYDGHPRFMPGLRSIVFMSSRVSRDTTYDYEIWMASVDGKNPKQISKSQSFITYPAPSGDGLRGSKLTVRAG